MVVEYPNPPLNTTGASALPTPPVPGVASARQFPTSLPYRTPLTREERRRIQAEISDDDKEKVDAFEAYESETCADASDEE